MKIAIDEKNLPDTYNFDYVKDNDGVYKSTDSDMTGYIINNSNKLFYLDDDTIEVCVNRYWKDIKFVKTKINVSFG